VKRLASLVALGILVAALADAQGIRRWRTPDGGVHFGENPPSGSVLVESREPWSSPPVARADEAGFERAGAGSSPTEARREAADACQKELEARVRDPRSLEIGDLAVSETAPAAFAVSGSAATTNAYGRPVRSRWTCRATVAGFGRWRITLAIEDVAATELALDAAPAAPAPSVRDAAAQPVPSTASDAPPWLDAPAAGSDVAAISPTIAELAPPRLSSRGRAVEFSSAPEIHWGSESRKTIAFCVENFTNDWRKVAIRIGEELHQIGVVGPRATECNEIDTTALVSGDAADLMIDERVASADEIREFGASR
jgi:hypothetical protein